MSKLQIPFIVFAVIITLGLAVSLQSVFGLNIAGPLAGPLNLGTYKITNVGTPSASGDAATVAHVESALSTFQKRVTGTCPVGQGIQVVAADGSVTCQSAPADNDGDKVLTPFDCNDSNPTVYPGSKTYTTAPDGLDQNCDGSPDNKAGSYKVCGIGGGSVLRVALETACIAYCGAPNDVSWELGGSTVECSRNSGSSSGRNLYRSFDWNTCNMGDYGFSFESAHCADPGSSMCRCPGSPDTPRTKTCGMGGQVNKEALVSACKSYCGGEATVGCNSDSIGNGYNGYDWDACTSSGSSVSGQYCLLRPQGDPDDFARLATCACSSPQLR